MPRDRTTLFCAGFSQRTRAKDLAYEFERFGRLVRCDIPAPKSSSAKAFAFVEFEDYRDADDAYYEMQGARFEGHSLSLQWAKQAPSRSWRHDDRDDRHGGHRRRSRSRSPIPPPARGRRFSRSPSRERDGGMVQGVKERSLSRDGAGRREEVRGGRSVERREGSRDLSRERGRELSNDRVRNGSREGVREASVDREVRSKNGSPARSHHDEPARE